MQKGQALLVVLLILGVSLTVGLAIVSRSVTEVSVSTSQEESARALEAAEAGVEKSLAGVGVFGASGGKATLANNAQITVTNNNLGGTTAYVVPEKLDSGDVTTVSLMEPGSPPTSITPNQLRVCWGDNGSPAAVAEVMIYTQTSTGSINIRRWMLGPGFYTGFAASELSKTCPGSAGGYIYSYRKTWHPSPASDTVFNWGNENLVMMRIRILGTSRGQPVAVSVAGMGGTTIPVQAKDIISSGTAGTSTQKIHVVASNPDAPFMFDSALFSGTDLVVK